MTRSTRKNLLKIIDPPLPSAFSEMSEEKREGRGGRRGAALGDKVCSTERQWFANRNFALAISILFADYRLILSGDWPTTGGKKTACGLW
jgi:hypothetical protein